VIKLFTDVSYKFSYWAIVFVLLAKDKHYRMVVFADKAEVYPSGTFHVLHSRVGYRPWPQTID
jgi:hypothetical protein